jgi:hypothetical protein
MSYEATLTRISEISVLLAGPASAPAPPPSPAAQPASGRPLAFAAALRGAQATPAVMPGAPGDVAGRIVAAAQGEVGQAEMPPGSNDSPRIAEYRSATTGAGVGPWCAYFTSWCARQAGVPVGDAGEGFGSVDALYAWAQRSGKALAAGAPPRAGDLIVFDEHIGVVESVLPDGRVQTIEGNSSDRVSRRVHAPGDALGYVRLG